MPKFCQFLCILIAFSLACNAITPIPPSPESQSLTQPVQESNSSAPPNHDTPIVVLKTGNPEFALTALFEKGETLIAMTKTDATGEIVDVTGAIFIAPDGRSIAVYFENGLPVRAIAEGHVVEFYNFTDSTVDVAVVAPDGTVITQTGIPFDAKKIYQVNKSAMNNPSVGGHLVGLSLIAQNEDIDWIQFASTALGAFSCAATIASGGTLSILFGIGCAFFVYTTYFQATEQEIPILVEGGDSAVSAVNCGVEIAKKDPMAIPDCGKLVIDTAKSIQESSSQTYEKQKRVVEDIKLKSSKSPSGSVLSCSDSRLTPEECANLGKHKYHVTTIVTAGNFDPNKYCRKPWDEYWNLDITFSGDEVILYGVWWNLEKTFSNTGINTYVSDKELKWIYTLVFNQTGFTIEERQKTDDPATCIWNHTFSISP